MTPPSLSVCGVFSGSAGVARRTSTRRGSGAGSAALGAVVVGGRVPTDAPRRVIGAGSEAGTGTSPATSGDRRMRVPSCGRLVGGIRLGGDSAMGGSGVGLDNCGVEAGRGG